MNTTSRILRLAGALAIVLAAAAPTASLAAPNHDRTQHGTPVRVEAPMHPTDRDAMRDHDRMPPPRFEHRSPMPHHRAVWQKGHWRWERGQWVWIAGLWLAR